MPRGRISRAEAASRALIRPCLENKISAPILALLLFCTLNTARQRKLVIGIEGSSVHPVITESSHFVHEIKKRMTMLQIATKEISRSRPAIDFTARQYWPRLKLIFGRFAIRSRVVIKPGVFHSLKKKYSSIRLGIIVRRRDAFPSVGTHLLIDTGRLAIRPK